MIKLSQLHMPIGHTEKDLHEGIAKALRIPVTEVTGYKIIKQSIDARKKRELSYSYVIAAEVVSEERLLRNAKGRLERYVPKEYRYRITGERELKQRPVVVGAGPAGLFCAYLLAKEGYRPILLERGKCMEERIADVEHFFASGELDETSNVQFGEGGAGTFSDGKLNTLVKDKDGKFAFIIETFLRFGAPEEIAYRNKPHIGTDCLRTIIVQMRKEIERMGGEVRFGTKVTDVSFSDGALYALTINDVEQLPTEVCVLAIGHSARDTLEQLYRRRLIMEPKAFAVGVRVQHKREWVNETQYGVYAKHLPTADYKLTHTCENGRGVYSFCMCPGGYVVNASSERGRVAVNGMSNHDRMGENSNAAIVVTISPEDYCKEVADDTPLCGMYYQRALEEAAYREGNGSVPTQRYEDFLLNRSSTECGSIRPANLGAVTYGNLRKCLPNSVVEAILEGMEAFECAMPGYGHPDALMSAVESRTSSPVRILRDDALQAPGIKGLYPCGEGAGYAGGITSAAMDGIRIFEAIAKEYTPFTKK